MTGLAGSDTARLEHRTDQSALKAQSEGLLYHRCHLTGGKADKQWGTTPRAGFFSPIWPNLGLDDVLLGDVEND
ncbi:Hypothetical predicted protein [Scomber scombrus]|uniref:Uncharacterized protein n=1 Tax=Scomber scombrus TaxID=13677 RepID=A0AAV1PKB4_SCOSC